MCYPCSHCGACKVHLNEGECPFCGEKVAQGALQCQSCGGILPLPPGQAASDVFPPGADTFDRDYVLKEKEIFDRMI